MTQNRRNWTDFEDKAILTLVKKYGTRNWAQISQKMSSRYGIETRSGKQCRQRWHNHLNPQVKKDAWTAKQQKIMFQAHQKYGNKWTQIAKLFQGRTDNDIKNHFYSMLRRSLRRVNKILGMRNSTKKVRLIKPSVLSRMFAKNSRQSTQSEDWKKISQALFQFSKAKSVQDLSNNLESEEKKRLQDLIEKIVQYNQQYELTQLIKKQSRRSSSKNENENARQNQLPQIKQNVKRLSSRRSLSSNKSTKIKRNKKIQKNQIIQKHQTVLKKEQSIQRLPRKESSRGRDKKSQKINKQLVNEPKSAKKMSTNSINQQFSIPELFEQQLQINLSKKSSLADFRKSSSYKSSSFYFNSLSPRMDGRIFTRTPQGPTPNTESLNRNLFTFDWKSNNDDLDSILYQTRNSIAKKTKQK